MDIVDCDLSSIKTLEDLERYARLIESLYTVDQVDVFSVMEELAWAKEQGFIEGARFDFKKHESIPKQTTTGVDERGIQREIVIEPAQDSEYLGIAVKYSNLGSIVRMFLLGEGMQLTVLIK